MMEITKEVLMTQKALYVKRRTELQNQVDQTRANINALSGAIDNCDILIKFLETADQKEETDDRPEDN